MRVLPTSVKTAVRGLSAAVAVALVISLSVAPAAAQYPPSDPPVDSVPDTIPTQVAGTSTTNTGGGSLAFTGATIGGIAGLGTILVAAGGLFWLVGQRRRPTGADVGA